jgi:FlaA1/EpsC-like NDP-sugar epimerase
MLSNYRKILIFLHDVIAVNLIWYFAFMLRYNFYIPSNEVTTFFHSLLIVTPIHLLIAYFLGIHRATWRYFSFVNLKNLIVLAISVALVTSSIVLMMRLSVPRSVLVIYPILCISILGGNRYIYRYFKENNISSGKNIASSVVIYGAGAAGAGLVKDFKRSDKWNVVAFLDDNKTFHGRDLLGIPVLGGLSKLRDIQTKYGLDSAVIAMPSASNQRKKEILAEIKNLGLNALSIPSIEDLISGKIAISEIKSIEPGDLLRREQVNLDSFGLNKLIKNNVVLVSGAGGSIGSELCRQILHFNPSTLICLDMSEIALYKIEQEFIDLNFCRGIYLVADVKNKERLTEIFNQFKPNIIFHAAAYKHVPLMEHYNVSEALINNVIGTYHLAQIAKFFKTKKFVLVSTDKAVNPTNVMGASKHLAEIICRGLQLKSETDFVITRFGNVLGSSGSVIPKFREQIAAGGPVTVTHPEMTRYFMSIPEAAQLVMQASLMGKKGQIFVLDMGEPIKIVDLAKDMIKLCSFDETDIKIKFTGLRPGEKLYEELLSDNETIMPTSHPKLKIAASEKISEKLVKDLIKWVLSTTNKSEMEIKRDLKRWVKGYSFNSIKTSAKKRSL